MKDTTLKTIGLGLITAAVTPTPDDITIISPAIQLLAGAALLIYTSRR